MKSLIMMSLVLVSFSKVYAARNVPELKCIGMSASETEGIRYLDLAFDENARDEEARFFLPESFYKVSISNIRFQSRTSSYNGRVDVLMSFHDDDEKFVVAPHAISSKTFNQVLVGKTVSLEKNYNGTVLLMSCRRIK